MKSRLASVKNTATSFVDFFSNSSSNIVSSDNVSNVYDVVSNYSRVSQDEFVSGVPFWKLFVDVDELAASYDDYVLQVVRVNLFDESGSMFPNFGGTRFSSSAGLLLTSDVADNIFTAAAKGCQIPNVVSVGYHVDLFDVVPSYTLHVSFVYAVHARFHSLVTNYSIPVLRAKLHGFEDIIFSTQFSTVAPVISLTDSLQAVPADSGEDFSLFSSFDGSLLHGWLHEVVSAAFINSAPVFAARSRMCCPTVIPSHCSHVVKHGAANVVDVAVCRMLLTQNVNSLSRDVNQFRLVSSALFDSVSASELFDASNVVLGFS